MISDLDVLKNKKGDLFLKLVDLTKELDGPNLLMDTMLLSKEALIDQLDALNVYWKNEFTWKKGSKCFKDIYFLFKDLYYFFRLSRTTWDITLLYSQRL
jgi:hypothetical protein